MPDSVNSSVLPAEMNLRRDDEPSLPACLSLTAPLLRGSVRTEATALRQIWHKEMSWLLLSTLDRTSSLNRKTVLEFKGAVFCEGLESTILLKEDQNQHKSQFQHEFNCS